MPHISKDYTALSCSKNMACISLEFSILMEKGDYSIRKNKMAARFSEVSGRSIRR